MAPFQVLKTALTTAPVMSTPDWDSPFEFMCDASGHAVGAMSGQKRGRYFILSIMQAVKN